MLSICSPLLLFKSPKTFHNLSRSIPVSHLEHPWAVHVLVHVDDARDGVRVHRVHVHQQAARVRVLADTWYPGVAEQVRYIGEVMIYLVLLWKQEVNLVHKGAGGMSREYVAHYTRMALLLGEMGLLFRRQKAPTYRSMPCPRVCGRPTSRAAAARLRTASP